MNKRSAMMVAAGLVLTLVVGGVAVAVGMTGPEASSAQSKLTHKKNKPIIKTTKKTITVHKKGQAPAGTAVTLPAASSGTVSSSSGSTSDSSYGDDTSDDTSSDTSSDSSYGDDSYGEDDQEDSEDPGSTDESSDDIGGSGVGDD
ncbi:MAG: hypothetical protein ABI572_09000 [Actinomycetota bacterium]